MSGYASGAEHCLVKSYNAEDADGKPVKFVAFIAPTDPTFIRENASSAERCATMLPF